MTNVPNLHSLRPGWASSWVHWCCLPQKFRRYSVSTPHKGDTAAWGHHDMVQNTKPTSSNLHFCRNQGLQAQHQLPLRVPSREEELGATRILARTTMRAQDRTGTEGRRGWGWGWDERATWWLVSLPSSRSSELQDRPTLAVPDELGEPNDSLFLKSTFKCLWCMQSKGVGLVGGWWKGLVQNLRRRKLPALQVAQTRFSQSDPQDHQVLCSSEVIRPHYYFLGDQAPQFTPWAKNVKFTKTIFNRHTSPDFISPNSTPQKSERISFARELGMKF